MRNRRFVPCLGDVTPLESRIALDGNADTWDASTGVSGDWGDTYDPNDGAGGYWGDNADAGNDAAQLGSSVTGEWSEPPAPDIIYQMPDYSPQPAVDPFK